MISSESALFSFRLNITCAVILVPPASFFNRYTMSYEKDRIEIYRSTYNSELSGMMDDSSYSLPLRPSSQIEWQFMNISEPVQSRDREFRKVVRVNAMMSHRRKQRQYRVGALEKVRSSTRTVKYPLSTEERNLPDKVDVMEESCRYNISQDADGGMSERSRNHAQRLRMVFLSLNGADGPDSITTSADIVLSTGPLSRTRQ